MNQPIQKKKGRPLKEVTRDSYVRVRMTTKLKNELKEYSKRNGFNMTQVIEMALSSFMFEDFE